MIISIALVLFYLLTPILLIYLEHVSKTINKIGAVVMAYAIGLVIGNIGLFPQASLMNQIKSVQDLMMVIAITVALPLLLFSLDVKRWLKLAQEALLSLILGVSSLIIIVIAGYFLFRSYIHDAWQVAGMLCGVYTGGTPNLAAIGTALKVNPDTFILINTYDMVVGSLCLLFFLTIAQKLFNRLLPHFHDSHEQFKQKRVMEENKGIDNYLGMLTKKGIIQLSKALVLALLIVGISIAISLLVAKSAQTMVIILSITTLGLLLGTIQTISSIEKTFQFGMYFIIVFSLVIASMADLRNMFQIDFLHLFLYVAFTVFGSILVHVFLSYLFKVDSDTTIITMTALTFSPPFVPVVAGALKNKEIIITGITSGILGYAFGNYLGIGLAYFLKGF